MKKKEKRLNLSKETVNHLLSSTQDLAAAGCPRRELLGLCGLGGRSGRVAPVEQHHRAFQPGDRHVGLAGPRHVPQLGDHVGGQPGPPGLRTRLGTRSRTHRLGHAVSVPGPEPEEPPPSGRLFGQVSGGDLLSHPVARAVPSALEGLTSGFGMGPGVSPPL